MKYCINKRGTFRAFAFHKIYAAKIRIPGLLVSEILLKLSRAAASRCAKLNLSSNLDNMLLTSKLAGIDDVICIS